MMYGTKNGSEVILPKPKLEPQICAKFSDVVAAVTALILGLIKQSMRTFD